MKRELVVHGVYRHFKGNKYIVEDVAIDSETDEYLVQLFSKNAIIEL